MVAFVFPGVAVTPVSATGTTLGITVRALEAAPGFIALTALILIV